MVRREWRIVLGGRDGDGEDAVALYVRLASQERTELHGRRDPLAEQERELRAWANRHGRRVAGVYADDGVGGLDAFHLRPAGARLLADAEAGKFATVLVTATGRVGRSLPVVIDAARRLQARGVMLAAIGEADEVGATLGAAALELMR